VRTPSSHPLRKNRVVTKRGKEEPYHPKDGGKNDLNGPTSSDAAAPGGRATPVLYGQESLASYEFRFVHLEVEESVFLASVPRESLIA